MQLADPLLIQMLEYIKGEVLPMVTRTAEQDVLESKHYSLIDGVLQYESPTYPGRWCVVVPTVL